MRFSTLALAPILAFALVAPFAAADLVSTYETEYGSRDCANPGDYGTGETDVIVDAGAASARVVGSRFCYNDFENGKFSESSIAADASGPYGELAYASWSGGGTSCFLDVIAGGHEVGHTCSPAGGPPDPGWGHVLP
ncbi:MAG: hypothetical protein ACYDCK_02960 [Thermoplasmatota archaeon]